MTKLKAIQIVTFGVLILFGIEQFILNNVADAIACVVLALVVDPRK